MEMRRIKLSSSDSLHLERNYTYTLLRNHISIFFDLCRYFHIFVHTRRHSRVHRCNETRQMRRSDAEREREREDFIISQEDKISRVERYLPWSSRDYRYNLCWNRHRIGYISYYVDKAAPLFLAPVIHPETDEGFKALNAPLSNELFRVEIRLAPRSKRGVIALHPIINI